VATRALLHTEARASLDQKVTEEQTAAAVEWATERLQSRDVAPELLAVAAVILTTADPQRVRVLADLEPLTRSTHLPVWAQAWLAVAWHRRLGRVDDHSVVDRIVEGLSVPTGAVPLGPAGLGTTDLTRASILWALLQLRPEDARISALGVALERSLATDRPRGGFERWIARLALVRLYERERPSRQRTAVEIWVGDELRHRAIVLGDAESSTALNLEPGTHQLLVASPTDSPVWAALDLTWTEPSPAIARGFGLTRSASRSSVAVGETVTVTHRVVVPTTRSWVQLLAGVPFGFSVVQGEAIKRWPRLEPGIYEHTMVLRADRPGRFQVPPSRIVATQQPWNLAATSEGRFHVTAPP
jgi:hypothetical protein